MKHHLTFTGLNARVARQLRQLLLILCIGLLTACAGNEEATDVSSLTSAYQEAKDAIAKGNYTKGVRIFEAIQARYPFSDLSRQIQLELMYAYYKSGQRNRPSMPQTLSCEKIRFMRGLTMLYI
jgi:outer membrane protein assembly factor BamD (BamD/ComL family)